MEYINYVKAKAHVLTAHKSEQPILTAEDEEFLNRITSDDQPPPLPVRSYRDHGGDAQIALLDGAQIIPLPPITPYEQATVIDGEPPSYFPDEVATANLGEKPKRKNWSWFRRDSRDSKMRRDQTASDLHDLAKGVKPADAKPNEDGQVSEDEAEKEEEDMTIVLEKLNLAAVNNRVFSISDETQELLVKFNQVFKDLIKGVPTAYGDLESLLTNGDRQLQSTYNSLPSFLQKLIQKLPDTVTKGLGPEMLAVAAERATKAGVNMESAGKAAGFASKMMKTPNLKDLVGKPGAIAGMLRSIVTFLRARFPAFLGMNVLWSLALFGEFHSSL